MCKVLVKVVTAFEEKKPIYRTVIRAIVIYSYGSEVWALSRSDENTLKTWERRILSKIFGPL